MLKKLVDKKLEQFKIDFPNYKVSKKTSSLYTTIGNYKDKKIVLHTGRSVTKGTLSKLGTKVEWEQNRAKVVYLLSNKGKLMLKTSNSNFKLVTLKDIRQNYSELSNVFFIGKKYEWLKDYPKLWSFKFFQSFNSLSEAKKFLQFSFISDSDFINLFGNDYFDYLAPMILAKNKKNVVRLYKNIDSEKMDLLKDYITLCIENNFEVEIPAGVNRLEELHNEAMWEVNKINAENYSKEYKYDIEENFTKLWKEKGLNFKRLETPYEMYCQGIKQQHCIGTNYATTLDKYAFYTFIFKDKEYDLQLSTNGRINQFYGRKNTPAPLQLTEIIKETVGDSFKLIDVKPNLDKYPLINNNLKDNNWW